MRNKVKDIDIQNQTCYFFNDIINTKHSGSNNVKLDEKSQFLFKIFSFTILDI